MGGGIYSHQNSLLPKVGSDHNLILSTCGDWELKKYFKFEAWWMEVEGLKDKLNEWWGSFIVNGPPGHVLAEKLKLLKTKLKEWSKNNRENWKQRKEDILNQVSSFEAIQDQKALTDDELLQKTNLAMVFEEVAKNEEISRKQRSRIQWLKYGDKNTNFFSQNCYCSQEINSINTLEVDGVIATDPEEIKDSAQSFYQDLYKETEPLSLQLHETSMISSEEQVWLQRQFEEEEILSCIRLCAMEKPPGPDDFPMIFFLSFCGILKEDII